MPAFYLRHPELAVVGTTDRATFVLPGRPPFVLSSCDPVRVSAALQALSAPVELGQIEPLLDLRDLLVLVAQGFVLSSDDRAMLLAARGVARAAVKRCKHLVLGVSGAIGAVNTVPLVLHLFHHFAERIDVVLTASAARLVRPEIFAYLGLEAWTDAFAPRGAVNVPHIFLAGADLVVVAPASAHTLHKLATGACSDLLSLVVAATKAPVVVAPSMNVAMWDNPAIARNVAALRSQGLHIVEPSVGLEVSEKSDARLEFGPASLDPAAWIPILEAVLDSARPKAPGRG